MLLLSLLWAGIGLLVGLIALGTHLRALLPVKWIWLRLPATGMLTALLAGWLGTFVSGKLFATPTALWVSILCVAVLPRVTGWLSHLQAIRIKPAKVELKI